MYFRVSGYENAAFFLDAVVLLSLLALNHLYRISSATGLPMLSAEAIRAGWPYWTWILVAGLGCLAVWRHAERTMRWRYRAQ